jgi:hypothetical protein
MRLRVFAGLLLASLLYAQSLPEMRMLPTEMRVSAVDGNQIGSSGLVGVHTRVLFGDPPKLASIRSCCSCLHTRRFRGIRTATIAWRRWSQALGTALPPGKG